MSLDANSAVTDEEVEVVAEELAKIGGVSWYPDQRQGPLMRGVMVRYRAQACRYRCPGEDQDWLGAHLLAGFGRRWTAEDHLRSIE